MATQSQEELLNQIRQVVREEVSAAVARVQAAASGIAPADAPTEPRTIRHNLFSYDLPGGGNAIAYRGDTVELLAHDVARGEKFDAFTAHVGDEPDAPTNSTLAAMPVTGSDEDMDGWVASGSVPEIVAAVDGDVSRAQLVLAAEQRRGESARKTLLEPLAAIVGRA